MIDQNGFQYWPNNLQFLAKGCKNAYEEFRFI